MPSKWSAKRERQYEHIRDSARAEGKSEERAKEIAARTVNKQRREDGETDNTRTEGTGKPSSRLEDRNVDELINRAKQLGLDTRGKKKEELIKAIRAKQN